MPKPTTNLMFAHTTTFPSDNTEEVETQLAYSVKAAYPTQPLSSCPDLEDQETAAFKKNEQKIRHYLYSDLQADFQKLTDSLTAEPNDFWEQMSTNSLRLLNNFATKLEQLTTGK